MLDSYQNQSAYRGRVQIECASEDSLIEKLTERGWRVPEGFNGT